MAFCALPAEPMVQSQTPRAASVTIHHQVGFHDRAVRSKGVLQSGFSDIEGKVPHKQF